MTNIISKLFFITILFWSFGASSKLITNLRNDNELIQSSKCMAHFNYFEKKHSIPKDLLHSISLQETGRKHSKLDKKIPWPWTVNVAGKGYYFNSKNEAVSFVRNEMLKGKKNIDVGCMQISMMYHGDSFNSISDAFDPRKNVEYGASFLKEKYVRHGTWKKAIANYHSADTERGTNYQKSVLKIASNIDKHKIFKTQPMSLLASQTRPLHVPNYVQQKPSSHFTKKDRYKSRMMVYVPKNARRIN